MCVKMFVDYILFGAELNFQLLFNQKYIKIVYIFFYNKILFVSFSSLNTRYNKLWMKVLFEFFFPQHKLNELIGEIFESLVLCWAPVSINNDVWQ
jgi:hypothetical protein